MCKIKTFLLACSLLSLIASCNDSETHLLTPVEKAIIIYADQTVDSLSFYTFDSWTAASQADWLAIDGDSHQDFVYDNTKCYLCKAYLKAGIDLGGFNPMTDVTIDPDETMITLTLPSPTLLSLNMPIDGIDVLYEKASLSKGFNLTDLNDLLRQGEIQIRESVPELGILDDARRNARLFFEPLFKQLGFTSVQVVFKDDETKE